MIFTGKNRWRSRNRDKWSDGKFITVTIELILMLNHFSEFPSMAALISKRDGKIQCGATIIDQYYALTAAHCINSPGKYADNIELLVGEHDYRNRMPKLIQTFF